MNSFTLYQDTSQRPILERITDAADAYTRKHGVMPTICLLHPSQCERSGVFHLDEHTIDIDLSQYVQPTHLLLGVGSGKGGKP